VASDLSTTTTEINPEAIFKLVSSGDMKSLTQDQKTQYIKLRCDAMGIDWRTAPLRLLTLQGKEVLYAPKEATDQLAAKHGVVCEIVSQVTEGSIRTVTVRARSRDGRQTDEIGCVSIGQASGDALCNLLMKAVTKAKRRAILSVCGLGMMDESELETTGAGFVTNGKPPMTVPMKAKAESPIKPVVEAEPIVVIPVAVIPPVPASGVKLVSVDQAKRLHIIAKENGWPEDLFKVKLEEMYGEKVKQAGKVTTKALTADVYEWTCAYFAENKPRMAGVAAKCEMCGETECDCVPF
jgi:hypothetical protein